VDKNDIFKKLAANRSRLKELGVKKLTLFGSYARGSATPESDLDFLVAFEKKSFDNYMDLKFFLEKLLQSSVDLVIVETLKPRIREQIAGEMIDVA